MGVSRVGASGKSFSCLRDIVAADVLPQRMLHTITIPDCSTHNRTAQIHTTAAYYPDEPPKRLQKQTREFFLALAQLYPCSWCREDFKQEIAKDPPR